MDDNTELLTRGVENIIPDMKSLRDLLSQGKPLNIYLGIDPTAVSIHIGHAVPLRKLQKFAERGHHVTFLIGDFTALIGDTSDKESERPHLTSAQIEENFRTYKKQAEKILDFSKVTVRHNSEWLSKLSYDKIIQLMQHFSAGDFYSRELVKKRLTEGKHVGLHELMYPVMQGYDSYIMDTDIQLGGTDQTFNMQAGRILQKDLRGKESYIIANGFLTGTDNRKMSKTWNNAIWLTDEPNDMFGKVMSLKDNLIVEYFLLATNAPMNTVEEVTIRLAQGENPMQLKKELAHLLVSELHSPTHAAHAQQEFELRFQKKDLDHAQLPTISAGVFTPGDTVVDILVRAGIAESNSVARRLIVQNAVKINDTPVSDPKASPTLGKDDIVKAGKKAVRIQ